MAKQTKPATPKTPAPAAVRKLAFCNLPEVQEREFGPDVNPNRVRLIRMNDKKWLNGTKLHYYFFAAPAKWKTTEAEKNVVRKAFKMWKDVGIGLEFEEVNSVDEAEIRIGFLRGDGAWSYIGRDILTIGRDERTMNFGWDLTSHPGEIDTAIHEIGHSLGFPHEHQNPNAGIVWDEEAVYASLAAPPNRWSRQTTFHNIISKISADVVQGSNWDPDSIMHYPFEPGLIKEPSKYRDGLTPAGGISARDKQWVQTFYPVLKPADIRPLEVLKPVNLSVAPGQQMNFRIAPPTTRRYQIATFGTSDTVLVLFEEINGELRQLAGDDDSGQDSNAKIQIKLFKGRRYVVRLRLYYAASAENTALMMW